MAFLASILSALFGAVLKWIASLFTSGQQRREDVASGVASQSAAETARTATVEARMADAEASTDRSQDGIAKAAEEGRF